MHQAIIIKKKGGASNEKKNEQSASSGNGATSGQAATDAAEGTAFSGDLNSVAALAKRLFG